MFESSAARLPCAQRRRERGARRAVDRHDARAGQGDGAYAAAAPARHHDAGERTGAPRRRRPELGEDLARGEVAHRGADRDAVPVERADPEFRGDTTALFQAGINVEAVSQSLMQVNMQFVIGRDDYKKAIIALNRALCVED